MYPPSTNEISSYELKQSTEEMNDPGLPDVIFHHWGEIGNTTSLKSDGKGVSVGMKQKCNEEEQQNQQENDIDSKMKASGTPPAKKAKKAKTDCSS